MEEICLKCDYVIAGDVSGIMFNHVGDFSTVSVKSSYFYVKLEKCPGISRDFFRVSRDFPCFPGISTAFPGALSFFGAGMSPPTHTHKMLRCL